MLINTVPDDCLMYSGFYFIFNITSIVNVFMLSIEKKYFRYAASEANNAKQYNFK